MTCQRTTRGRETSWTGPHMLVSAACVEGCSPHPSHAPATHVSLPANTPPLATNNRQGLLRGMPAMLYHMTRNSIAGRMGWGPKYTVTVLQHQAHKGLDQVRKEGYTDRGGRVWCVWRADRQLASCALLCLGAESERGMHMHTHTFATLKPAFPPCHPCCYRRSSPSSCNCFSTAVQAHRRGQAQANH